jgi:hypothetical protein
MSNVCGKGAMSIVCQGAWDIITNPADVKKDIDGAVSSVTGDVLSGISQDMATAATGLLKTLSTFWMSVQTPDLTSPGSAVTAIEGDTSWIVAATAVVCILVAAGKMAIRRRGEPAGTMLIGLVRLVVVSAAATAIVAAAGKLGDTFSADLMSTAHLGSGGWSGIISTTAVSSALAPGSGMLLIVALLIIISSLIQLMLMVLRLGLLIILTGTLPLAAAASMSDWGETWWRRHLGWLAAWLLYKPTAALLYAAAFVLTQGKSLTEVLSGFMLLILSVLILPALLKVIVPMTASLGAASGGTLALGAAGALATGAIKVASMAGTGGASGAARGAAAVSPTGAASTAQGADTAAIAGAEGAAGKAAAPSGSATPAGNEASAASDGAGHRTYADPPSHQQSGDAEQTVEQRPGSPSRSQDGIRASASAPAPDGGAQNSPPPGGGPASQPGGGVQPADGSTGRDPGGVPSGSLTADPSDAAGPGDPPGAADNGDGQEREIGG